MAANTSVRAPHFNASFAISCSYAVAIFVVFNHANALLLASYSTSKVIKLNKVLNANKAIPIKNIILPTPPNTIHPTPTIKII